MPDRKKQRAFARDIVAKLRTAGHLAYWAGGCVRDQLLDVDPKDYDVATDATPAAVRSLFGHRRTIAIGAAFGVITVIGDRRSGSVEVATFRQDADYSDGRHPDSVTFSSPQEDALRRDFTINGLFFDPIEERVIDFVGGQDDLRSKVIRAIGNASARIREDKLRMLRAVRFATTLNFAIDPPSFAAVQNHAHEITTVSAERIGVEVRRMLVDANRARALCLLDESGLLQYVVPELHALAAADQPATGDTSVPNGPSDRNAWDATQIVAANLADPKLPLALAAALHRIPGSHVARSVGRRLRYSNKEIERADWLLLQLPVVAAAHTLPWPQLQRLLVHEGIDDLLTLREAIAGTDDRSLLHCRKKLTLPTNQLDPPPLITGDDLVARGMIPGKWYATILTLVRDAQLNQEIASKEEALRLVDQLSRDHA